MKLHERQAIELLFARLAAAQNLPLRHDAEAARLIGELIARQPDAPYLMAQTIIGQAQALSVAHEAGEALESGIGTGGNAVAAAGIHEISDGFLASAVSVALAVGGGIALETKSA